MSRFRRSAPPRPSAAALALMAWSGCVFGPDLDDPKTSLVRKSFATPLEYFAWWDEISECSGLASDIGEVRFLAVVSPLVLGGTAFPCGRGAHCNGIWEEPHDITLAPAHLATEVLVKHEMLHELSRASGHPPVFEACDVTWGDRRADPHPER